jgi:hypothetical protein
MQPRSVYGASRRIGRLCDDDVEDPWYGLDMQCPHRHVHWGLTVSCCTLGKWLDPEYSGLIPWWVHKTALLGSGEVGLLGGRSLGACPRGCILPCCLPLPPFLCFLFTARWAACAMVLCLIQKQQSQLWWIESSRTVNENKAFFLLKLFTLGILSQKYMVN